MKASFRHELKTVFKIAKVQIIFKFFTSLLIRGILLIIPVLFSSFITYITKGNIKFAIYMILVSIILTLIYRITECVNNYAFYKLYSKLFSHYNSLAVDKTNDNSTYSLSRFNLGQYTNIVITDVDVISSFFSNGIVRLVQVIEFIVIYIYFYFLDKTIFLVALTLSIVLLLIAISFGKKIQAYNQNRKQKLDTMTSSMHEYFNGIKEMKSFNFFNKIAPSIKGKTEEYLKAHSKYNTKSQYNIHTLLFVIELFRLITLLYTLNLVNNKLLEIGTIIIIYNYYQKLIDNFSTILTINIEFRNLKVSFQRFYKIIEFSHKKNNNEELVDIKEGKITFENILYGYKDNPILNRVSFTVNPNQITVITGLGNGKNGIFDLLLKFNRAHEGNIYIDDININSINDDEYYNYISSVRKQPMFYNMSIIENLHLIEKEEKKIKEICKRLKIDAEINQLKHGYNTIISDEETLEDSLKQMLSITRILLKNTKIMLFEDNINELNSIDKKLVMRILRELKETHTIIIISNDEKIIKNADDVIVLKNNHLTNIEELGLES